MIVKLEAAILEKIGENLKIRTLQNQKLQKGQVLVKIFYSGICRSQLMEVRGKRGADNWVPHLLGHEGSGQVVAIGRGVKKVKINDDVILGWIETNGLDAKGAKYIGRDKLVNSGKVTTFSNYSVVSENRISLKPKNMPFDIAVLFGCALPTGAGIVLNELRPNKNSSVIIYGLGGIGLASLITCRALGIKKIIAIDGSIKKVNFAKKMGIKFSFKSTKKDLKKIILKLTKGGADYCIESCGETDTIEESFKLINSLHGKLIFASHPKNGEKICIDPHELIKGKKIYGSWGGSSSPDEDIPIINNLINKKFNLRTLIAKKYKLKDINKALKDLEEGKVFRPLIEMQHN